jgi:RimJ/RimL family protein N-acetyltransferase
MDPRHLLTGRLRLDALSPADAEALAEAVFADPEVVRMLAHDVSRPGQALAHARGWCEGLGAEGAAALWAEGLGLWGIRARAPELADPARLMGACGFYLRRRRERLEGEFFYALSRAFHGQRVMTEAAAAAIEALAGLSRPARVYAVYWDLLNPASGRVLARAGFRPAGRRALLAEYDAERLRAVAAFDLWRLGRAAAADRLRIAREAGIRAGMMAAEGVLEAGAASAAIAEAAGGDPEAVEAAAVGVALGLEHPGYALVELETAGRDG